MSGESPEDNSSAMSNDDEWEGIKFTWKIENFSHYIKYMGGVTSPLFGLNTPVWQVIISIKDNHISISVNNLICKLNYMYQINNLGCSVECLNSNGLPSIWKHKEFVKIRSRINFESFIEMNNSNNSKFLPNDLLTIQCRLWRTAQGFTSPVSRFAHTRIEPTAKVMKKTFTWDVVGVSSLLPPQYFERRETLTDGHWFKMKLNVNSTSFGVQVTTSFKRVDSNFSIYLLEALGKRQIVDKQFNKAGKFQNIDLNIEKTMLMCYPNQFLPSDILSLQFICKFTANLIFNRIVEESEFMANFPRNAAAIREISEASVSAGETENNQPAADPPNTITHPPKLPDTAIQSLQEVLNEGLLSDFNLRVGEKVFPVHKVILAMRSQVFRAMFTSEMKEKEDNFVDIPDVDEDSLQRLLQFVYSDKFDEDMGWDGALNLYAAADKYALDPLKQRCSKVLKSELSISNVLEVLSLADLRLDQDLKSATLEFISLNDQDIVDTEMWNKFEEGNAKLALNTLRNLYKKKMNA